MLKASDAGLIGAGKSALFVPPSGESLAAGVIFTLPALIIMNSQSNGEIGWDEFPYLKTAIIALVGGTIGVLFSISLRRIFVVKEKLPYPEGVACAEVLVAGEKGGTQVMPIIEKAKEKPKKELKNKKNKNLG